MPINTQQITRYLRDFADGDGQAFDQVVSLVYSDLRDIAHRQLRRARFGEMLDTTGLVHEAYMKMVDQNQARWQDRQHFFAITAHAMRQIIVDYARRRCAQKRGGGEAPEELDEGRHGAYEEAERILALNDAIEGLAEIDERMLKVVECRFFAGLSEQETAEALNMSLRTVQRTWKRARAWLKEELG
ncbi:MAG: ECF-type sigma factor [Acidobacteriota bacterium]